MKWPDAPTIHAGGCPTPIRPLAWERSGIVRPIDLEEIPDEHLPPGVTRDELLAPQEPTRRCTYCGSLHPEDLLAALAGGAKLGGAGWKYGWPHKFYVDAIPVTTPDALWPLSRKWSGGKLVEVGWARVGDTPGGMPRVGKFYNEHLLDDGYDDEARELLMRALQKHGGIAFSVEDGRLRYAAPHPGYQR